MSSKHKLVYSKHLLEQLTSLAMSILAVLAPRCEVSRCQVSRIQRPLCEFQNNLLDGALCKSVFYFFF